MIEYKQIDPQYVDVYQPNGEHFARVNEHELQDIRLQIKNQELEGYYVVFEQHRIHINSKGQLEYWPKGFFDLTDYYLCLLLDFGEPIKPTDSTISP